MAAQVLAYNAAQQSQSAALSSGHSIPRQPHLTRSVSSDSVTGFKPPDGLSFHEWLKTWTDADVARWLLDNRVGVHAPSFEEHDIRGDILLDLDQNALKEMGIGSVGDRIKIIVAIKKLRGACVASSSVNRRALNSSTSTLRSQSSTSSLRNNAEQTFAHPPKRSGSVRGQQRIPPPLHLHESASNNHTSGGMGTGQSVVTLPARSSAANHAVPTSGNSANSVSSSGSLLSAPSNQYHHPQNNSHSNTTGNPPLSPVPGHMRKGSSPRQAPNASLPPILPAPKGGLPPPPSEAAASRERSRTSSASQGSVDFGRGANPNIPLGAGTRSTKYTAWNSPNNGAQNSGSSINSHKAGQTMHTHRKAGSLASNVPTFTHNHGSGRPSTANAAGYGPHQPLSHHPYATNSSPTLETFGRPGTAKTSLNSISEAVTPTLPSSTTSPHGLDGSFRRPDISAGLPPASSSRPDTSSGYAVGKGGFGRPVTPAGANAANSHVPLEDLMRRTVKFIADDGVTKLVNVENARDANDIIFRVLKKFGKLPGGAIYLPQRERDFSGDCYVEMEGWGIFASAADGSARALTENELYAICQAINRPERQRGLSVKRLHLSSEELRNNKRPRNKLRDFFGEDLPSNDTRGSGLISPTSPTHMLSNMDVRVPATTIEPASPTPSSPSDGDVAYFDNEGDRRPLTAKQKKLNRASTVSVMSGLLDWNNNNNSNPAGTPKTSPSIPSQPKGRLRSFFGHRPPSELIQGHLADYFPSAEKRLLNKTVRNSFRRSVARPKSQWDQPPAGWDANARNQSSRFSISSAGSSATSRSDFPPPLPSKEHYAPVPLNDQSRRSSSEVRILRSPEEAILEEEDNWPQEVPSSADEDGLGIRPRSRLSVASSHFGSRLSTHSRSNKDSDTASLLTLDEITQEVGTRRRAAVASGWTAATRDKDRTDKSDGGQSEGALSPDRSRAGSEENEESDGDEEDESEEEEETSDEEDASPAKMTSTGAKNQIKWIKGALIGAGSFGEVFLAMNAMNGTLMAVKQVEIPTDDSHNASRKKSMLDALEREIELLKGFQHPHIVEYLDSSSDGVHLNIFLEYVPGGSVAALLRNYGAFEEPLVKTFVRQIVQGLAYLHDRDIIHRDIKGANILVDNKGMIKISDFGISKRVEDNLLSNVKVHRPSLQGSVFWMAPEVVKQTAYTSKADIWSLGCVTVEMLTGDHPYVKLNQMQALFKIGSASASPELPSDITIDAQRFLESTFALDYKARPSAADLLQSAFLGSDAAAQQTPTASTFPR